MDLRSLSTSINITQSDFYNVFRLDRGRHHASLQLCSRGLRDNAGALVEFELSKLILYYSMLVEEEVTTYLREHRELRSFDKCHG